MGKAFPANQRNPSLQNLLIPKYVASGKIREVLDISPETRRGWAVTGVVNARAIRNVSGCRTWLYALPGGAAKHRSALSVAEEPKPKKPTTNKKPRKATEKSKKTQERTVKAQRKKSIETLLEREFSKGKVFRSVVCRLQTICPDQRLVEEIKRTARGMKQIQLETWHHVNLHTLRCLENDLALPDYGKIFFDHCCAGVDSTSQSYAIATKNPSLWDSIQIYRAGRTRAGLEEVANMTGYSELKQTMREQLVVNAGVMIREHFRKRLRAYVLIKFGKTGDDLTSEEEKASKKLVGQIMYACYNVEETDMLEALQMQDVLTPDGEEWSEK
ncbi:hypothetical protein PC128_g9557 [Phytophthora cactorum]|nr:hypothetical protein PC128_g9557 [Phytophthora cactorum]